MHVPDGFLRRPDLGGDRRGRRRLRRRRPRPRPARSSTTRPRRWPGSSPAFIFAAQMLTFPVGVGTSGHLMGGALAAVLVGPWTAILCLSVVFIVQCLLFADGGITALGTNITLMGLTTVAVGWLVFKLLQAVLPKRLSLVPLQAGIAAFLSVPVASPALRGALRGRRHGGHRARHASRPRWSACTC